MKVRRILESLTRPYRPSFTLKAIDALNDLRNNSPSAGVPHLLKKLKISRDDLVKKLAEDLYKSIDGAATIIDGDTLSIYSEEGEGNKELNRRMGPTLNILNLATPRDEGLDCEVMLEALHMHHLGTYLHSLRVTRRVGQLMRELNQPMSKDEALDLASTFHDLGKMAISQEFLRKPGKLSLDEAEIMELHQKIGYLFLRGIKRFRKLADIMLFTHIERGYPKELVEKYKKGEAKMPEFSHFLILADTFDACMSFREYRDCRMPMRDIFEEVVMKHLLPRHPLPLLIASAKAFKVHPEDAKNILASVFVNKDDLIIIENSFRDL